jgi:hypothetical protein
MAFQAGVSILPFRLAFQFGNQHWHFNLAVQLDIWNWHYQLALQIGISIWHFLRPLKTSRVTQNRKNQCFKTSSDIRGDLRPPSAFLCSNFRRSSDFCGDLKQPRAIFLQSQNILLPNRSVDNSGRQVAKAIFWHLSNCLPTHIAKAIFWQFWWGNYFHMVGEPVSACRGNRSAGCGGTARPGFLNAYLIQKVRTPSGKPGWGIIPARP